MVKKYPYLIGDFMWTSWDYLGEAGRGAWSYTGGMPFNRPYPWLLGGAGVIDILGNPDASCGLAKVVWEETDKPVIGVRPFLRLNTSLEKFLPLHIMQQAEKSEEMNLHLQQEKSVQP